MDRIFNKNYENRYSKNTQSPGISALFGGATQNTDKEVKFSGKVNQQIVGSMSASPDKSVRYNQTYKSTLFEHQGYKGEAEQFYNEHDGGAAVEHKYETPVKTGSALNVVGRGNNSSAKRSEAGSDYSSSSKAKGNYSRAETGKMDGFRTETEWVICCGSCSNDETAA